MSTRISKKFVVSLAGGERRRLRRAAGPVIEALEGRMLWSGAPSALYHFDEGSGDLALDSSGNGNTGVLSDGGVGWVAGGHTGGGLGFDGESGFVDLGNPAGLNI